MRPKLIVYDTNRKTTTQVVLKFAQGVSHSRNWDVRFVKIDRFNRSGLDQSLRPGIDAVASLGILRGTGSMFRSAAKQGIDFYYMDHAYFDPGYKSPGWMRIVKNAHSCNRINNVSSTRFDEFFAEKNKITPWKTAANRGNKIIVCPPTPAVSWYTGLVDDWEATTVAKLKSLLPDSEHHRIKVRRKPKEPTCDQVGNPTGFVYNHYDHDFEQQLQDAFCVITYNSMVALTATMQGIPVIVEQHSCCWPISFNIEDFLHSAYPENFNIEPVNRTNLIHCLANNQWNLKEIGNGKAWQMLQENNQ